IPRQQFLGLAEVPARHRPRTGGIFHLRFRWQAIAGTLQIIPSQLHAPFVYRSRQIFGVEKRLVTPFALRQAFLLAHPLSTRQPTKPTRGDHRAVGGACKLLKIPNGAVSSGELSVLLPRYRRGGDGEGSTDPFLVLQLTWVPPLLRGRRPHQELYRARDDHH